MASIISAGTTSGTSLNLSGDTSGVLQLASNGTTTAVTIDTNQRAAFVAGTDALPAITTTGDTNTGIFFPAADTIAFAEGGAEAMRIDSSGQVGIGTTSPSNPLDVKSNSGSAAITMRGRTSDNISTFRFTSDDATSTYGQIQSRSNGLWINAVASIPMQFFTADTERMRITSSGDLLVGTTSNIARIGAVFDGNTNNGCVLRTSTNASGTGFLYFQQDTTSCGSVVRVGATSAVTYATTSDYRLKENIVPMAGALARVLQLNPVTYTWKQGGESAEGFIAHELAEVCPDAVVGTKDQVETYIDDEGNEQTRPKYQAIDTSFLVATLTAAIQELKAELDATKAEVQALKGVA